MTMNRRGLLGLFGAGAAAGCATVPSGEGVAVTGWPLAIRRPTG